MVLVTGGAGYIGSHAVVELLDRGYQVTVVDNLENGIRTNIDPRADFYPADLRDEKSLEKPFQEKQVDYVMNFAAFIRVDESVDEPLKYYENNVGGVINLLKTMRRHAVDKIVFSSTAAVYGEVKGAQPVTESHPLNPINPYGMSKFMAEQVIRDAAAAYDINFVLFRYFNVSGAHEHYNLGQSGKQITALVHMILETAIGNREKLQIFGDDYSTPDGTCIRDYIHVVDLVEAHILGLNVLQKQRNGIYNLGNGNGFSVMQMVEAAGTVVGKTINCEVVSRRPGDPISVVADSRKAVQELGWSPRYTSIKKIIETVWNYKKRNE